MPALLKPEQHAMLRMTRAAGMSTQSALSGPNRTRYARCERFPLNDPKRSAKRQKRQEAESMATVPITIACGNYDRTAAIRDGRVKIEGCEETYLSLEPEEIFHRAFRFEEFDVCEMSFSSFLRTVANGTAAYVGIPAFVSRIFRHSGIYVRTAAGIHRPQDLRGKRVGVPEYQITAVVCMRGMLQHEYGVHPSEIHWYWGGQEQPGRQERTPLKSIPGIDLQPIRDDQTLVGVLKAGELDALFTARAPSSFIAGDPHIARLFADTRAAEIAFYKKTGLFPIMHLVGIRKTLAERYPWLATSVYKAFCEAKALAMSNLTEVTALPVMLPFLEAETRETMAAMGRDFWSYGVHENLREIEALAQYAFEQGLLERKVKADELFCPATLEMSRI